MMDKNKKEVKKDEKNKSKDVEFSDELIKFKEFYDSRL